ncbi:MAG TPA: SDR family NAD(P)-dependent oxidoreductase [Anaeromyxobacter sp.]|nr:SDR family NAD(P)-dependent oxidoreductase [Anaeromyxobacter sp.]
MRDAPWKGLTALVTGASSGLGADFARHLAADGAGLILTARRADALEALAADLRGRNGVPVAVVPLDLAAPGAPAALVAELGRRGLEVDVLINNAGFGLYGEFLEIDPVREREMMILDVLVPLELTRSLGGAMIRRGRGFILQVSSIGGYQPTPLYAVYSAAKAFILSFGEAVAYEWRRRGVTVSVLCPGVTATSFLAVAGQAATAYQRAVMMDSPTVTRAGLDALARGTPSVLPGVLNKLTVFSSRFAPRRWLPAVAHRLMRAS